MNQANIEQDAEEVAADPGSGSYCQVICVWQEGADALLDQYKDLASTLPKASNLEVMVLTKKELMRKFKTTERAIESTTAQINAICKNISLLMPNKQVFLYIDECWITVPRQFSAHLTHVSTLINLYNIFIVYFSGRSK